MQHLHMHEYDDREYGDREYGDREYGDREYGDRGRWRRVWYTCSLYCSECRLSSSATRAYSLDFFSILRFNFWAACLSLWRGTKMKKIYKNVHGKYGFIEI